MGLLTGTQMELQSKESGSCSIYLFQHWPSLRWVLDLSATLCLYMYIYAHTCRPLSPLHLCTVHLQQQIPHKVSKLFKLCVLSWEMLFCRHCKEPLEPCDSYSIASNQSEHFNLWPLTWARHLSSQVDLNGCFLNFGTILCEPSRRLCGRWWKSKQQFLRHSDLHPAWHHPCSTPP